MEKIICDICGTEYPETEEVCPLCGCSRDMELEVDLEPDTEEDFLQDSPITAAVRQDGKLVTAPKLPVVNPLEDEDDDYDEDEEYDEDDDEPGRGRTGVVIVLCVVIFLLLATCGYLFIRYLLPNMGKDVPSETVPTETEAVVETTTEPGIPCEQLILMSGAAVDLTREGEYRLINVIVKPADTTDKLEYYSADETVATVNKEGRITAISEGETVITVVCGDQKVECRVFIQYMEPTEEPTEGPTLPPLTQSTEGTESTEPDETETQPTQAAGLKDVTLRLGRTDISMGVGYEFTIPLDCDLEYDEIEWSTGNAEVATIENGVIKTHRRGTTQLIARYGDQVVTGWIRVK